MRSARISLLGVLGVLAAIAGSLAPASSLAADPDTRPTVTANTEFALDLYARLAAVDPAANLFFSPYSVSVALAMVAEGARGETAAEMGETLRLPDAYRNTGEAAVDRPWNLSAIHRALGSLSDRMNGADRPDLVPVRERIKSLRRQLDETNGRIQQLWQTDTDAAQDLENAAAPLVFELQRLLPQVDQYELRVANALWGEQSYPFQQSYIDTVARYYKTGGIFPLDFLGNYDSSIDRINAWVEQQTNLRIKDLIPRDALSLEERQVLRLILTSAVYFHGAWANPFPAAETKDTAFVLTKGGTRKVPMMHHLDGARYAAFNADGTVFNTPREIPFGEDESDSTAAARYPAADGFAILEMLYKGEDLSMVLIVPRSADGLPAIEKRLSSPVLSDWIGRLQSRTVSVYVPRFRVETSYDMGAILQALGMTRAFRKPDEPLGAQFDGMCASADPRRRLYISRVVHKAFVEVTEEGTEAAAATGIMMGDVMGLAKTSPFVPTFRADRPFLYLIRDRRSGSVLFLGRMNNPA